MRLLDRRVFLSSAFYRGSTYMLFCHCYVHLFPFKDEKSLVLNVVDVNIYTYTSELSCIVKVSINCLVPFKNHSPAYLSLAHGEEFYRFHEIVAEPVVEAPLYLPSLSLILLRETVGEMPSDQSPAIAHEKIDHAIETVGYYIQRPQRQKREQRKKRFQLLLILF